MYYATAAIRQGFCDAKGGLCLAADNDHFEKALMDMKDSFAGRDGIKHLADLGYPMRAIKDSLDYPFPMDKIGKVLWNHYLGNETILLKAPGSGTGEAGFTYIRKTDAFGKQSFIRVTEKKAVTVTRTWKKIVHNTGRDIFNPTADEKMLAVKEFIDKYSVGGPDYVSLHFGRLKRNEGPEWHSLLSHLSGDERDYAEAMPWESSLNGCYHLIDDRMLRMLVSLEGTGCLPGVYYFAEETEESS